MNIVPLFPSTICITSIDVDISENFNLLKCQEFIANNDTTLSNILSTSTRSLYILKNDFFLKTIIEQHFNRFKNDTLNYMDTSFKITTSWGTKTEKNQFSNFHQHKNSFYSGVLFFQNVAPEAGGKIEFENDIIPSSFLIKSLQPNIFNGTKYIITPKEKMLVFFPSYLRHRISLYTGEEIRYSLAFNIVPVGSYGAGDSSILTTVEG